jgi:pilus assembly protein Flp/PilA
MSKKQSPNSILFSSMRTYIQIPEIPAGGSSGFHPIGINGVSPDPREFLGRGMCNWLRPKTVGSSVMMKFLKALKSNKSGASAAEYALILAVLGGITLAGAQLVGTGVTNAFNAGKADLDAA